MTEHNTYTAKNGMGLWRRTAMHTPIWGWVWAALHMLLCGFLLAPIAFILLAAFGDNQGIFGHLIETVFARYLLNTIILMVGVGALATLFGVSTAWLVSRYQFFGSRLLSWLLILPLAMPAYIVAYAYTDFLEYAGPVQTQLRAIFGWQSARDYWFFDIRSHVGAIIVMSAVLYPYIYILTRTAFLSTARSLVEAARLSGKNMFRTVALPLARPAIIAGLSLVLMEVVSDFGTVDYFSIETLTLGIFNVWLGMNNMPAAAQLALVAFVIIVGLLLLERWGRSRRSFENTAGARRGMPARALTGLPAFLCIIWCVVPILLGFIIPAMIFLNYVIGGVSADVRGILPVLISQSLLTAAGTALLVVLLSVVIVILTTFQIGRIGRSLAGLSATGYAFPGTILALGVLYFATQIEAAWHWAGYQFGVTEMPTLILGGMGVLIIGYMVRFQAVGYGGVKAGIGRMPADMMPASRSLGHGFSASIRRVILPLLRPSMIGAMLLVFVDVLKELPLTLLLRPFDFDTFATFTYQYANEEMLSKAALPALLIVATGLVPVLMANYSLTRSSDR